MQTLRRILRFAPGRRLAAFAAAASLAVLAGCTNDPGAVLIPLPERPVAASPAEVPATTSDGYPNVVATPVVVAGTPLEPAVVAADEKSLAAVGGVRRPPPMQSTPAQLEAIGAAHVGNARAAIDGT